MPIYEYKCSICNGVEERIESLNGPKEHECLNCHTKTLMRQISKTAFSLGGQGWFSDGYQNTKNKE